MTFSMLLLQFHTHFHLIEWKLLKIRQNSSQGFTRSSLSKGTRAFKSTDRSSETLDASRASPGESGPRLRKPCYRAAEIPGRFLRWVLDPAGFSWRAHHSRMASIESCPPRVNSIYFGPERRPPQERSGTSGHEASLDTCDWLHARRRSTDSDRRVSFLAAIGAFLWFFQLLGDSLRARICSDFFFSL